MERKSYKVSLLSSSPHALPPPQQGQQHKGVRVLKEPEEKNCDFCPTVRPRAMS